VSEINQSQFNII